MAKVRFGREHIPRYEVWRFVDGGYNIIKRTSQHSADDEFIARDLSNDEMWAMVKILEQPCVVLIETQHYHNIGTT